MGFGCKVAFRLAMFALGTLCSAALRSDAAPVPSAKWQLLIGSKACPSCAWRPLANSIRDELGNLAGELMMSPSGSIEFGQIALLDPTNAFVARFDRDTDPRRIAARLRFLLMGRFDNDMTEVCASSASLGEHSEGSSEVRDHWQKGL